MRFSLGGWVGAKFAFEVVQVTRSVTSLDHLPLYAVGNISTRSSHGLRALLGMFIGSLHMRGPAFRALQAGLFKPPIYGGSNIGFLTKPAARENVDR